MIETFKCLIDKKTVPIVPVMLINGLNLAFNAGFLTNIIKIGLKNETENESNKKILYVSICLGIAETLSGLITG